MAKLSLSKAWDESRGVLSREGRLIGAIALAMFFLPGVIADVVNPNAGEMPSDWQGAALMAVVALIGLVGQLAIIRLVLGPRTSVGEAIGHGARRAPVYFLASLIWLGPLLVLGYVIGIDVIRDPRGAPPGSVLAVLVLMLVIFYLVVRMLMTSSVATAEQAGPVEIVRRSWQMTRGHWWRLFGFLCIFLLVVIVVMAAVGAIIGIATKVLFGDIEPFSVGALFVAVFTQLASVVITTGFLVMLARIYAQLSGVAPASVPTSGT